MGASPPWSNDLRSTTWRAALLGDSPLWTRMRAA